MTLRVVGGIGVGSQPLVGMLRRMADDLEAGEYGDTDEATVVFPGASEVFHLGGPDRSSGASAIFNCSCAIAKLTKAVIE